MGSLCVGIYETCAGGGALPRVCTAKVHLCPGVAATCAGCGCDSFLGGDVARCDGDVKVHPYQNDSLRLCGYQRDYCKNCHPGDGGVACSL